MLFVVRAVNQRAERWCVIAPMADEIEAIVKLNLGDRRWLFADRASADADAEALARVLGEVDTSAVKRDHQTEVQHPVFSPLSEQWEDFVQFLTRQPVRQATVKTADDRLAVVWSEFVRDGDISPEELEAVLIRLLQRVGRPLDEVSQELVKVPEEAWDEIFS